MSVKKKKLSRLERQRLEQEERKRKELGNKIILNLPYIIIGFFVAHFLPIIQYVAFFIDVILLIIIIAFIIYSIVSLISQIIKEGLF